MNDLDPQAKLDAALSDLLREIATGAEYPDAHWRVANRWRVPGEALQEMYDAHHE